MLKTYQNIKPMLGNVIGAKGYYGACIRTSDQFPECDKIFWENDYKAGDMTRYDIKNLPSYAPQSFKNNLLYFAEHKKGEGFIIGTIFRHFRNGNPIVIGWAIHDKNYKLLKSFSYNRNGYYETVQELIKIAR